jgi:hypothetical protein
MRMRAVFENHKHFFEEFITQQFGILEEVVSTLDYNLSDQIINLHGQACTIPIIQMEEGHYEALIWQASRLLRLPHFETRLGPLLGGILANELNDCIALLARPQRTFDTVVRAARACPTFEGVTLHRGLPFYAGALLTTPPFSRSQPKSPKVAGLPSYGVKKPQVTMVKPKAMQDPKTTLYKVASTYLPPHESDIGPHRLEPKEKQHTFHLTMSLFHGLNPDPEWEAYYAFGYPVCRSEDQHQALGGLYKSLLNDGSKVKMFSEIWKALQSNSLTTLMDQNNFGSFRQEIPDLEKFLDTEPNRRETVWQLVQFVRAKSNTDPLPTLQIDYGFDLCKVREDVMTLKNIYAKMFEKFHPLQVHNACMSGTLLQTALDAFPSLERNHHRFLPARNRYPGIGYVGTSPGASLSGGFFRNRAKVSEGTQPTELS